ncbi:MAG: HNH endonuclease, partial [Actinomycetota bacterium]|nr:HNH endonuclease [Actinomycetota bacterium]
QMFARSEPELVQAARIHSIADLGRVTAFWRQRVDQERSLDGEERLRERRRLHASVSFLGMVRVDGDLDPETGETLLTALGAVLDSEARSRKSDDDRTPPQRRADALGEICRQWLDSTERPNVGGERPHVILTVGADTLAGEKRPAELDHVGPVQPETAKRIACDASVMRVVMAARSEPLDVGRRTPVIPPSMRRAVIVRDRHCRFPGCDRPHTWCDAHHVLHWADGGPTALPNLLLMCRRHHRMVHRAGGFRLELLDGRPVFRRPDGSVLQDRAPP